MKKLISICFIVFCLSIISFGEASESPDVITPYDGEVVSGEGIELKWQGCNTSSYYLVTLKDIDLNTIVIDQVQTTSTSYTIDSSKLVNGHRYQVTVTTNTDLTENSNFSVIDIITETFNVPVMRKPYYGQSFSDENIHVDWESAHNAEYYLVTLVDETTNETILNMKDTLSTEYLIMKDLLMSGHTYKVSVASVNNGDTKWVDRVFIINGDNKEIRPEILYPDANQKLSQKPLTIEWDTVVGSDHYLVTVTNLTSNTTIVNKEQVINTTYDLEAADLSPAHQYKIEVISVSDTLETSDVSYFQIKSTVLEKPEIIKPLPNQELSRTRYRLDFTTCSNAEYYLVTLKDMTNNTFLVDRLKTNVSYYDFERNDMVSGHQYKIAFAAVAGDVEKWNESFFYIKYPEIKSPNFLAPKENDVVAYENLKVDWQGSDEIDHYLFTLKNLSEDILVYDDMKLENSVYTVLKSDLKPGHSYEVLVSTIRNSEVVWETIKFMVEEEEVIVPKEDLLKDISYWAIPFARSVVDKELLNNEILDQLINHPKSELTRVEFCEILIELYDGFENPVIKVGSLSSNSFTDISHLSKRQQDVVLKANALGIIRGESDIKVNPDASITREQMSTMLLNTYNVMYGELINLNNMKWRDDFTDIDSISDWAVQGVQFTNAMSILKGDDNKFNPKNLATHEMAFVLIDKSFQTLTELKSNLTFKLDLEDQISEKTKVQLIALYNDIELGYYSISNLTISSSNNDIASVDGETIIPLKDGEVTIRVELLNIVITKEIGIDL